MKSYTKIIKIIPLVALYHIFDDTHGLKAVSTHLFIFFLYRQPVWLSHKPSSGTSEKSGQNYLPGCFYPIHITTTIDVFKP